MRYLAIVWATAGCVSGLMQQCSTAAPIESGGNWYCGAVSHILYQNVGMPGTYQDVKDMSKTGECSFSPSAFSGPLAPLDEPLSVHVRGPVALRSFAAYTISTTSLTRCDNVGRLSTVARRQGHIGEHRRRAAAKAKAKREDWVTATIDGQVVSWINTYHPETPVPAVPVVPAEPAAPAAPAAPGALPAPVAPAAPAVQPAAQPVKSPATQPKQPPAAYPVSPTAGYSKADDYASATNEYTRVGYYSATDSVCDGIVFLGNYGGQGSGLWDEVWGNSLAYLSQDGLSGATSPSCLRDTTLPSNKEFSIFSSTLCNGNCGYERAPDVSYAGFGGSDKVFLFEFMMPLDGDCGFNGDMPAIWLLNARIPLTGQYSGCSCWASNCGELDVFEVLSSGDERAKTTLHTNAPGGSSDYLVRPTTAFTKLAVVFDSSSRAISISILPESTDFGAELDRATVQSWMAVSEQTSLFQVAN